MRGESGKMRSECGSGSAVGFLSERAAATGRK